MSVPSKQIETKTKSDSFQSKYANKRALILELSQMYRSLWLRLEPYPYDDEKMTKEIEVIKNEALLDPKINYVFNKLLVSKKWKLKRVEPRYTKDEKERINHFSFDSGLTEVSWPRYWGDDRLVRALVIKTNYTKVQPTKRLNFESDKRLILHITNKIKRSFAIRQYFNNPEAIVEIEWPQGDQSRYDIGFFARMASQDIETQEHAIFLLKNCNVSLYNQIVCIRNAIKLQDVKFLQEILSLQSSPAWINNFPLVVDNRSPSYGKMLTDIQIREFPKPGEEATINLSSEVATRCIDSPITLALGCGRKKAIIELLLKSGAKEYSRQFGVIFDAREEIDEILQRKQKEAFCQGFQRRLGQDSVVFKTLYSSSHSDPRNLTKMIFKFL